jgi:hypothetical protein
MTISSALAADLSTASEIQEAAERLAPSRVLAITPWRSGGNSRIYKVDTDEDSYALKRYPKPTAQDPRNRLDVESRALSCMRRHGFTQVPRMVAADDEAALGLLSWCEGEPLTEIRDDDAVAFAHFLTALDKMNRDDEVQGLPHASEACISGAAILSHIQKRVEKLKRAVETHEGFKTFFLQSFLPAVEEFEHSARNRYQACGLSFEEAVPRDQQALTPSDFGGHNALRSKSSLIFLDFEYFGWDDPVTSAVNFILHPAMKLTERQKELFLDPMHVYFQSRDPLYAVRLNALLPLYAARWTVIILSEFIPEHWLHRVASDRYALEEKETVLDQQLKKAKAVLEIALAHSK